MKNTTVKASRSTDSLDLSLVINTVDGPVGLSRFGEDGGGRPIYGIGYGLLKDREALLLGMGAARRIAKRLAMPV